MPVRLSVLRAGRSLLPRKFLVLIPFRGRVNCKTIVRLEGIGTLEKKSNDLMGIRARYLSACDIVPQPTALSDQINTFPESFSCFDF
jgi:hypothetical protein